MSLSKPRYILSFYIQFAWVNPAAIFRWFPIAMDGVGDHFDELRRTVYYVEKLSTVDKVAYSFSYKIELFIKQCGNYVTLCRILFFRFETLDFAIFQNAFMLIVLIWNRFHCFERLTFSNRVEELAFLSFSIPHFKCNFFWSYTLFSLNFSICIKPQKLDNLFCNSLFLVKNHCLIIIPWKELLNGGFLFAHAHFFISKIFLIASWFSRQCLKKILENFITVLLLTGHLIKEKTLLIHGWLIVKLGKFQDDGFWLNAI